MRSLRLCAFHPAQFSVKLESLAAGEMFVKIRILWKVADVFAGVGLERVFAKNFAAEPLVGARRPRRAFMVVDFAGAIGAD